MSQGPIVKTCRSAALVRWSPELILPSLPRHCLSPASADLRGEVPRLKSVAALLLPPMPSEKSNKMNIRTLSLAAIAAASMLLAGAKSEAGFINGSQGVADLGGPTANTGNINTATSFTLGNLFTTGSQQGTFV